MKKNISKQVLAVIALFILLVILLIRSFINYNQSLIAHQQQQLLKIVRSVSNIIDTYIDNQKNALLFLMENDRFDLASGSAEVLQYLKADTPARVQWLLVDQDGTIRLKINNPEARLGYQEDIFTLPLYPDKTRPYIPGMYLAEKNHYLLPIVLPFSNAGETEIQYAVTLIDMKVIDQHVGRDSVKADEKSYLIVKDQDGFILLHESKKQIGLHAIEGRRENYPDVDFTSMNQLIEKELEGKEDTFIFDSYWFSDDKPLIKAKKFSAFTPLPVDYGFWIVSINMDYNDFIAPFNKEMLVMTLWLTGILALIGCLAILFLRLQHNQRELTKETEYLRELNTTLEQLNVVKEKNRHAERLQLIGVMTGGIAHEFNNILSPIMGYSELLWNDLPENSIWKDDAFEIYDASCRAKELILQISSLSYKPASGITFQTFSLKDQLKKWMKSVLLMKPEGVRLETKLPDQDIWCYGNATQLYEAVLNLCTNAIFAIGDSGTLTVALEIINQDRLPDAPAMPDDREMLTCISVKDTGTGMNQETLEQIFMPFYTTKKQGEGTGLGLSIVQSIVQAHNGIVWAESSPGQGTTIRLCIPYCPVGKELPKESPEEGGQPVLRQRIIIIDQHPTAAKSVAKILQKQGYLTEVYEHPRMVIEAFRNNPDSYQVLISSYRLAELDGVTLALRVRQIIPDIRIVILSGLIKNEILDACQKGIVDDYIMKPVKSEELLRVIIKEE